jgi:hypothetical protein
MEIELTPTLIDMYRETFEGEVQPSWCWIVSGPAGKSVLGSLAALTADEAYAVSAPGRKSIAAHAAHLKFTLELTNNRLHGENPPADWPGSFHVGEQSPAAWEQSVLDFFDRRRNQPISAWEPIHVVGLAAMIGHNAYHLGAIRQLLLDVRKLESMPAT